MNPFNKILWAAMAAVMLSACGGADSGTANGSGTGGGSSVSSPTLDELAKSIHHLDMSSAQGFIVTGDANSAASPTGVVSTSTAVDMDANSLYKVTANGTLVRVGVMDENNNELPRGTIQPSAVAEVNADYVAMRFVIWVQDTTPQSAGGMIGYNRTYLVHKATGLAYDASLNNSSGASVLDSLFENHYAYTMDGPVVFKDTQGNLYVSTHHHYEENYYKIDTSSLGTTSLSAQLVQSTYRVVRAEFDDDGKYMLFESKDQNGNYGDRYLNLSTDTMAIITPPNGGLVQGIFKGLNGGLYLLVAESGGDAIYQAGQDGNGALTLTPVNSWTTYTASTGLTSSDVLKTYADFGGTVRHIIGGKVVYMMGGFKPVIIEPELSKVTVIDQPGNVFSSINDIQLSSNYIFYSGTEAASGLNKVMRYDPSTLSYEMLSLGNEYDLNRYRVLSSDTVWFEALRVADGATVIGELNTAGTITITDTVAATEPDVIVMEAISPADFIVVDGDYQDWNTAFRRLTGDGGDASAGHDLSDYSDLQDSSNYFGLVEFNNDVMNITNARTIITWDNKYELRIENGANTFTDLTVSTPTPVSAESIGASIAMGKATEFRLPIQQLSGAVLTNISIVRKSVVPLDIASVNAVVNGGNFDITVSLNTPLDDAVATIALDGTHVLRFNRSAAELDNGSTITDLAAISGASIDYGATDGDNITVVIPATAIGSPPSITPANQSAAQNVSVFEDTF